MCSHVFAEATPHFWRVLKLFELIGIQLISAPLNQTFAHVHPLVAQVASFSIFWGCTGSYDDLVLVRTQPLLNLEACRSRCDCEITGYKKSGLSIPKFC